MNFSDPTGMVENPSASGGVIVNNSDQDIYIALDATSLVAGQANADVIIPLRPGESSNKFTSDADAVVVGSGQTISGANSGAFKIGVSSVEVRNGKNSGLVLVTGAAYQAQAKAGAAGYQANPPAQWQMHGTQTPAQQEKARQELARTRHQREQVFIKQQQRSAREKIRDFVKLFLTF